MFLSLRNCLLHSVNQSGLYLPLFFQGTGSQSSLHSYQPVDFETKRAYSLKVEAANVHIDPKFISNGPFKDTVTVKIAVEDADEPPMFLAPSYIHEVQENAAAGTVVGRVHAKDPDAANSPIRYTHGFFLRTYTLKETLESESLGRVSHSISKPYQGSVDFKLCYDLPNMSPLHFCYYIFGWASSYIS